MGWVLVIGAAWVVLAAAVAVLIAGAVRLADRRAARAEAARTARDEPNFAVTPPPAGTGGVPDPRGSAVPRTGRPEALWAGESARTSDDPPASS